MARPRRPLVRIPASSGLFSLAQPLAQLEADEAQLERSLAAALDEHLADRLVGVLDVGLLDENGFLVELLNLSVGDPLDDLGRLAGGGRLGPRDLALGLEDRRAHLGPRREPGIRSGDVHRQILPERLVAAGDADDHADAAVSVDVAREALAL